MSKVEVVYVGRRAAQTRMPLIDASVSDGYDRDARFARSAAAQDYELPDISSVDLETLLRVKSELLGHMDVLDEDLTNIKAQIDLAKGRAEAENIYSDPKWFTSAKSAQRHKNRKRQQLQNFLGDLNRRIRKLEVQAQPKEDKEALFIAAAKAILPDSLYAAVWEEVDRRRTAGQQ